MNQIRVMDTLKLGWRDALYKELYQLLEIDTAERGSWNGGGFYGEYKASDEQKETLLEFLKWSDKVEQVFAFGDYAGGTVDRYWVFRHNDQLYRYDATVNSWDNGNSGPWYHADSLRPVKEHTRTERYYE